MSTGISIITPTYNPPISAFRECVESVISQTMNDWEWCIADDCSTNSEFLLYLKELGRRDSRIRISYRHTNGGIVAATNTALSSATKKFVGFLDHDDALHRDALLENARVISEFEDVDVIYSDENKIDADGVQFDRFRKPDFSAERLRGQNYINHFTVIRRELVERVGRMRLEFEGAQDHDLVLRATEIARRIVHIPKILYHWRVVSGSTAGDSVAKPYAFESGRRAVVDHCSRVGIQAEVQVDEVGCIQVKRKLSSDPLVSIIIPTRGDRKFVWGTSICLVANCITSILTMSTYGNFEVVVVHDDVHLFDDDFRILMSDNRVRVVPYNKPFDFADKCNLGVMHSKGDVIILLNDDTQVKTSNWIESLIGFLQDGRVGMVGPKLLLEDGRIQSAGHGNNPSPHNLSTGEPSDSLGYFRRHRISHEVSGVTGACAAIPRNVYELMGGMSAEFPHSFNDVDFAFKLLDSGYTIIWTPLAELWHFESLSRDPTVRSEEVFRLHARWHRYFNQDQYTRII